MASSMYKATTYMYMYKTEFINSPNTAPKKFSNLKYKQLGRKVTAELYFKSAWTCKKYKVQNQGKDEIHKKTTLLQNGG